MRSAEQPQMLASLYLFSVTNNVDPRNVLVLGQGLPGLSSFRAPLCLMHGSPAALHTALLKRINHGQPRQFIHLLHQQQLSTPVIHHLELRLEVRCKRWGYVHPTYLSCHMLLSWAVRWQSCNNLHHWWSELASTCHLQTALKIKRSAVS